MSPAVQSAARPPNRPQKVSVAGEQYGRGGDALVEMEGEEWQPAPSAVDSPPGYRRGGGGPTAGRGPRPSSPCPPLSPEAHPRPRHGGPGGGRRVVHGAHLCPGQRPRPGCFLGTKE